MKILLVGASGLVGSHVLRFALADSRVCGVVAPSRHALALHHKLYSPIVNFDDLPADASWWGVDAVVCTLGTTIKKAGTQEAFRRVDHDYPLEVARLARQNGARTYALNSALGADATSRVFYSRVKGELERDLTSMGFQSLTFVRPGLIGGDRQEVRMGERVAAHALALLGPAIPRRWRLNPATKIAAALLEAAIHQRPGVHVVTSDQLI